LAGALTTALLVAAALATPAAAAVAPAAGDWPQFGRTAQHPNTNPAETAFTPGNVAGLAVAWTGQFGEADETEPVRWSSAGRCT
jgi:glucose dehydrogenase